MKKNILKYGLRLLAAAAVVAGIYFSFKAEKQKIEEPVEQVGTGKYNFVVPAEFEKHYEEYVIIDGEITRSTAGPKLVTFKFYKDFETKLTLVIFAKYFEIFPENPEKYYLHQKVRVTGFLKKYRGKPEIILYNPKQLEVRE